MIEKMRTPDMTRNETTKHIHTLRERNTQLRHQHTYLSIINDFNRATLTQVTGGQSS